MTTQDSFRDRISREWREIPWKRKFLLLLALVGSLAMIGAALQKAGDRVTGKRYDDFGKFYIASMRLHSGTELYDYWLPSPEMKQISGIDFSAGPFRNPDPPLMILTSFHLAFFSYQTAWYLQFGLSLVFLFIAVCIVLYECRATLYGGLLAAGISFCSLPVFAFLLLNRSEAVVILLGTLGWLALRRNMDRLGGCAWGLVGALKLFPGFWTLILLGGRRYRAGGWAAGMGIVSTLLSGLVIDAKQFADYLDGLSVQTPVLMVCHSNFSLSAMGTMLGGGTRLWIAIAGLLLALALFLRRTPLDADQLWVVGVTGSLLFMPACWTYYLVFLSPCLLMAALNVDVQRGRDVAVISFIFGSLQFWPSLAGGLLPPALDEIMTRRPLLNFVPSYGLVLFLVTALGSESRIRHP